MKVCGYMTAAAGVAAAWNIARQFDSSFGVQPMIGTPIPNEFESEASPTKDTDGPKMSQAEYDPLSGPSASELYPVDNDDDDGDPSGSSLLPLSPSEADAASGSIIVPEVQELKPEYYETSRRVKIRYGPFNVKNVKWPTVQSFAMGGDGINMFTQKSAKLPCSNCILTYAEPGLEYGDRTEANTDTGTWLFNVLMTNERKQDLVCPLQKERFFSAGNERMPVLFSDVRSKDFRTGYHVDDANSVNLQVQIMNLDEISKDVYFTVIWEYIPTQPPGWLNTRALFLSVSNCGIPIESSKDKKAFTLKSAPWQSTIDGQIVFTGAHLMDGGVRVRVSKESSLICDVKASYGGTPRFIGRGGARGPAFPHISNMTYCPGQDMLKKGEKILVEADYDTLTHAPLKNAFGVPSKIMAGGIVYVATAA